ncbi:MAG: Ig-like domain-containing protein, partial [Acidobacteriaceae bacterium]|nr:Ig-like domain-containing protein [Acidobacteriaceae bacterium]
MRFLILLFVAAVTLPAQTLSIVSGTGQIVIEQFLSVPMVVQASDASGKPVAGATVTWSITQGSGTLEGPPTAQTDANGQASMIFLATAVPPALSFTPITV